MTGAGPLRGRLHVDADKSISHRALLLGGLAEGKTRISNLLRCEDCESTRRAIEALGVPVTDEGPDVVVRGGGPLGLEPPSDAIDCGNSGTTMRLLAGVLAGQTFNSTLAGDASLSRRPMARIIDPLRAMGADISGTAENTAPLRIKGSRLHGALHHLAVASAQVKSCLLLAGLLAEGSTTVVERAPSRDHTERMLAYFGARVLSHDGRHEIRGAQLLEARRVEVCGDISSAAFFLVAAAIVQGSEITLPGVGVNPTRTGILDVLLSMGALPEQSNGREQANEPVADVSISSARLAGIEIGGPLIPRLIDEIPVLAVAATRARGKTQIRDASELRVKETDRIAAIVEELSKMGARIRATDDGLIVEGRTHLSGAEVDSHGDHRIAMALAVAALAASGTTRIRGAECIDISFPGFRRLLSSVAEVDASDG